MFELTLVQPDRRPDTTTLLPLDEYDLLLVSFSGGKDSIALVLHLLDLGVPRSRIQLWHQCVDGEPGSPAFMDWAVTDAYCRAFAAATGLRLVRQWREGGFLGELLKRESRTRPVRFERQDGTLGRAGGVRGKLATRRRFPQKSADLRVRWCSPALKIDVMAAAVSNEPRWKRNTALLVLTGERRAESPARSRYAERERHRCHTAGRRVDHWRAVIDWPDDRVWDALRRHRVVPHPAYRLGYGRLSCQTCIFVGPDEWATNRLLAPDRVARIAALEAEFGCTITRGLTVADQADRGTPFPAALADPALAALAAGEDYPADQILLPPGADWVLPPGAFRRGGGPT